MRALWRLSLVALGLFAAAPAAASADSLNVVDLGPTSGGLYFAANDNGQVAGVQFTPTAQVAVRWQNGVATPFGTGETRAAAIDAAGDVFGYDERIGGTDPDVERYPAEWSGSDNSETIDYAHPGGEGGGFHDASPNGTAIGASYSKAGPVYSFIQQPGVLSAGVGVNEVATSPSAVNDLGHAMGFEGFWNGSTLIPVDLQVDAGGLNSADDMVGLRFAGQRTYSILRHASGAEDVLPDLPGATPGSANAVSINDAGTIVGSAQDASRTSFAVVWKDGQISKLDDQLPAGSPWHLTQATYISRGGSIVGRGTLGGVEHSFLIRGTAPGTLSGNVVNRLGTQLPGVGIAITGQSDAGTAVNTTATTDGQGHYSANVDPGTYTVKAIGDPGDELGGAWQAAACPGGNGTCALPHLAPGAAGGTDFKYVECGAANDLPADKKPTGCPVIFVPGFLGSVIQCNGTVLWAALASKSLGANFGQMKLLSDGQTNAGKAGSCNAAAGPVSGFGGVLDSVAGVDAYGDAVRYLQSIAPGSAYAYPYDWRKGADQAVAGLGTLIDQVKKDTGAQKVTLWAHSMGGLVSRGYIDDPARAKNVARLLTEGTPYWGAPKSFFALLEGDTETPAGAKLDLLVNRNDLQTAVGNYEGLFWLYPSANYGSWLSLEEHALTEAGVERVVRARNGTPALLANAQAGHAKIDGFKTNGVDYQAVFGTGVPTIQKISLDRALDQSLLFARPEIGNGDGTVPLVSQSQGGSNGKMLGAQIPAHYLCGISHADETEDSVAQAQIKGFLLSGTDVRTPAQPCSVSGEIYLMWTTKISPAAVRASVAPAVGSSLSLDQAEAAGDIDVHTLGNATLIVTDGNHPVSLSVGVKNAYVTAQSFDGKTMGPVQAYAAPSGTLTLNQRGTVAKNGKALKAHKVDKTAPRTTARVRRKGTKATVTLTAKDAGSGVAKTYVQIGKAKAKPYTHAISVASSKVKSVTFSSTDRAGNVEKTRHA